MEIFKNPAAPQILVWFALPILIALLWWLLDRQR
jgi:hypothetical protein